MLMLRIGKNGRQKLRGNRFNETAYVLQCYTSEAQALHELRELCEVRRAPSGGRIPAGSGRETVITSARVVASRDVVKTLRAHRVDEPAKTKRGNLSGRVCGGV